MCVGEHSAMLALAGEVPDLNAHAQNIRVSIFACLPDRAGLTI